MEKTNDSEELMTPAEFAAFARVSVGTVRSLLPQGLPSVDFGGKRKKVLKFAALKWLSNRSKSLAKPVAEKKRTINNDPIKMKANRFSGECYSGNWDENRKRWKANIKKPDGSWSTKWCPEEYGLNRPADAEAFIIGYMKSFFANWTPPQNAEVKAEKTLKQLMPKWLDLRYDAPDVSMNYYKSLSIAARCWILDNKDFPHLSIENLNIENDFTVDVIRAWIKSLSGAPRTKVSIINALSVFFDDAIDENYGLSEDFINPMHKRPIKKLIAGLKTLAKNSHQIVTVPWEDLDKLVGASIRSIDAVRKVRVQVDRTTGMRENEINGLIWEDLFLDAEIPYARVERQLLKRGILPAKSYEVETAKGVSKDALFKLPNAIVALPKRGSKRPIPLHPETVTALKWWRDVGYRAYCGIKPEKHLPVFGRSKTSLKEYKPGSFTIPESSGLLQMDLGRIGCNSQGITFHALRRTFASELSKLGYDDSLIGRLLGHGKKGVTAANYTKTALEPLYAAICKLPVAPISKGETRLVKLPDAKVLPIRKPA